MIEFQIQIWPLRHIIVTRLGKKSSIHIFSKAIGIIMSIMSTTLFYETLSTISAATPNQISKTQDMAIWVLTNLAKRLTKRQHLLIFSTQIVPATNLTISLSIAKMLILDMETQKSIWNLMMSPKGILQPIRIRLCYKILALSNSKTASLWWIASILRPRAWAVKW